MMNNKLLEELIEIKNWINKNPEVISRENEDGRIDSLLKESTISKKIADNFKNVYFKVSNRSFGDIYIEIDKKKYPVNIKLTSKTNNSNDNLVGMVSLMSFIFFGGKSCNSHSQIAKKIKDGLFSKEENDYGFISITKETGECEVSTMITMEGYVVNPSNGFQANFNKINTIDKSFDQGRAYIINKYKEYLKKKAEAYLILEG